MKKEVFNKYAELIIDMFEITREQLFSKTKVRNIVDARYLLYYLCVTRPMPIVYLQQFLEEEGYETSHAPIIYGIRTMTKRLNNDPDYRLIVRKLKESLTI